MGLKKKNRLTFRKPGCSIEVGRLKEKTSLASSFLSRSLCLLRKEYLEKTQKEKKTFPLNRKLKTILKTETCQKKDKSKKNFFSKGSSPALESLKEDKMGDSNPFPTHPTRREQMKRTLIYPYPKGSGTGGRGAKGRN